MKIKLFENKIFRKASSIVKHLGVFFCAIFIFAGISLALPNKHVEVDYDKYVEIENKEKEISDEYNTLNKEFEQKRNELLEKKENISAENDQITKQIDASNKELKKLDEEVMNLKAK